MGRTDCVLGQNIVDSSFAADQRSRVVSPGQRRERYYNCEANIGKVGSLEFWEDQRKQCECIVVVIVVIVV